MNKYYENLQFVKSKLEQYLSEIFKVYGNELLLRLEEYNLLTNDANCIESSTATGYLLEEFAVSKLEIYTQKHNGVTDIKIQRMKETPTASASYDCYAVYENIFVMINMKAQKAGSYNNAVAAINMLHNDYVLTHPEREKAFLVFKINYDFGISERDHQRKVLIECWDGYFLEEIDFSRGHKQDFRNWGKEFKANSGRLQIPKIWKCEHLLPTDEISYAKTKGFIDGIFNKK